MLLAEVLMLRKRLPGIMIVNPYDKGKCIRTNFPQFSLHGSYLTSVISLKYLEIIFEITFELLK